MTSRENHEETVTFFETMDYFGYPKQAIKFFKQAEEPLISKDGKLLIGEDKLIKFASNGNGEIYKSLSKNGVIDDMKNKNIDYSNCIDYNSLVESVIKEKIEEMKTYEKIIQNGKQDLQDLRMTY